MKYQFKPEAFELIAKTTEMSAAVEADTSDWMRKAPLLNGRDLNDLLHAILEQLGCKDETRIAIAAFAAMGVCESIRKTLLSMQNET